MARRARMRQSSADEALISWLQDMESSALNRPDDDISEARSRSFDRYMGRLYGNELEGFSKVRTREVLESIEWAMPSLIRSFLHSPEMCRFKPVNGADARMAMQETKVINHFLRDELPAWEVMNAWFRDTLMYPNGYCKMWAEEVTTVEREWIRRITATQIGMLEADGAEILEATPHEAPGVPSGYFDAHVEIVRTRNEIRWAAVPPEEVRVAGRHNCIDLDKAQYVAHVRDVSRQELLDMGYDEDVVLGLDRSESMSINQERENRASYEDENPNHNRPDLSDFSEMEEMVEYVEAYGFVDYDMDGIAEYRKMCYSNDVLLSNEIVSYQPLIALGAIPQSHRHTALSMFDLSEDIQEINTTLGRQLLDNLYRTNRPRQFAGRGVNLEQLMSYSPFGVVDMNTPDDVKTEQIPSVIQQVLPAIEAQRANLETRTGSSRMMNGMDADKLAETTLGAFYEAMGVANQRLEFIVRCFAETGIQKCCLKAHHLIRTEGVALSHQLMQGEDWIEVNPREWRERKHMKARVGLGTGTQRERISAGMEILKLQIDGLEQGLTTPSRIYFNLEEIVQAMGRPEAGNYFLDPESDEYKKLQESKTKKAEEEEAREQQNVEAAIEAQAAPKLAQVAMDDARYRRADVINLQELRERRQTNEENFLVDLMKISLDEEVAAVDALDLDEARKEINE